MSEEQIFLNALDLPDEAARATYLDETCGTDAGLRQKVEALLAAHFKSGEFLVVPAPEQISVGSSFNHAVTIQSDSMPANHNPADDSDALEFLAPSTRPDSLGRIGHYEVLQILGKGGFGIVFRAFDDILQRVVAIKVMAPQLAATSPARKRFSREATSSAQVRHENVVQVYEVGEQPLPYLVMEFIPGETLQQMLDRMGPLDVGETVRIGRQIAEGLAAAHATDLIHRDIKPGNVLLEGGQHKVKITDFGLARAADDASMTQSGMIAGTPMYMAPEQVLGQTLDQRADLFSLGSVLYQMVAGRPPFRANTTIAVLKRVAEDTPRAIREVIPETPQWLCDIIAKLHAKKPEDRYQSAREVADVLADCEAQLKQNARLRDFSRIPRTSSSGTGTWKWAAVAAVLLPILALALTEITGVTRLFRGQQPTVAGGPQANPVSATAEGFVPLFNGKDLTGWKTNPEQPGKWEVTNGILVGHQSQSHLFTERPDFTNFHLRAEVKVNNGGDGGIRFRTPFALQRGKEAWQVIPAGGYEAEFNRFPNASAHTGSVWRVNPPGPPTNLFRAEPGLLVLPDEWSVYEVIADGSRFVTKLNGREVANCADPESMHRAGHIALQCFSSKTVVQFRKIEIKELPASLPAPDNFVQLFNGKNLDGWQAHPATTASAWRVENGELVGSGEVSYLFHRTAEYDNFHLQTEFQVNKTGNSGIYIRSPLPKADDGPHPQGYEAQIIGPGVTASHYMTGSLVNFTGVPGTRIDADTWYKLEVIADGPRLQVKLNGVTTTDVRDEKNQFARGHVALQLWEPGTAVRFRKIEIRELPTPTTDGFVALFNGKDLTGWTTRPEAPGGHWEVKDGVLIGSQGQGHLYSERVDFANFHLRVQAKVNLGGDSGIYFRLRSEVPPGGGYEAEIQKNRAYARKTGTIGAFQPNGPPLILGLVDDDSLTRPDEWFDLEIIAQEGHFITKINGQETANCSVPTNPHAAGHIGLQVWNPNTVVQFRKIEIKELPATPPTSEGFVALFNGKDLAGWSSQLGGTGNWIVQDGALTCTGVKDHLQSIRDDFGDFHLRAEAKINASGNSGIYFRTGRQIELVGDYEAQITDSSNQRQKTGSLFGLMPVSDAVVPPASWFTLEIIAVGQRLQVVVNGQKTVDYTESRSGRNIKGHISLQHLDPQTAVFFRKIEIKELPTSPPPTEGFVALFNGRDLTGWKTHSLSGGDWRVEDGAIDGRGNTSYLFSESGEYANFHLRVEAKVNSTGDAGVYFRTPFDVQAHPNPAGPAKFILPAGYEASIAVRGNHTGSLTAADGSTLQAGPRLPHQPDEWFVLEVIAEDNRIRTLVDGQPAADYTDEQRRFSRGHIALQTWGANITSVQFRRVEIKELPASAPPPVAPPSPAVSVQALRDFVLAKEGERDLAKQSHAEGKLSQLDLLYAEIDVSEGRIQLALAEKNAAGGLAALRALVAFREQERALIAEQVKTGVSKADDLERADSSLSDAQSRLGKAIAEAPQP